MNTQSFEIIPALMWLAGFQQAEPVRGVTVWSPIATGDQATSIIKRLIGIEALMTGINALVKIETFKRQDVETPVGLLMNPMLATDAELCVRPVMCLPQRASDINRLVVVAGSPKHRPSSGRAHWGRTAEVPAGLAHAPRASRSDDREGQG